MSPKLIKRFASAALIAPVFLYVIIVGGGIFKVWLTLAFLISVHEWYGLAKRLPHFLPVMIWGCVYASISYSSFLALREAHSLNVLLLFLGMIWFSDIGAYFVGKFYGGPKLIEHISPNKTWSGFLGALLFPALFGVVWCLLMDISEIFPASSSHSFNVVMSGILGAVMGSVGQAGDLLVSFVKRLAKVKDTGTLIPGHGGLLDRIDSMMLGAPVFLILITLLSYVF
ncbi:MAG: phosphatidate cytidylyltransferase [Alphaproteobacteria bacterium]